MTCPKDYDEYIVPEHATHLRVFMEHATEGDYFAIDAACEHGGYTEVCWTVDGETNEPIATLARAVELAQEFADEQTPHLKGTKPKVDAKTLKGESS